MAMHNVDRTQLESPWGASAYEGPYEYGESGEYGEYGEEETGQYGEYGEYGQFGEYGEQEYGEYESSFEGPFSEAEEMELAAELLEITSEEELDQFIGKLFKRASRAVGKAMKSPVLRGLGGTLKGLAKQYLPVAGAALGNFVVPGLGGMVGGQLASAAGRAFGLELEGMSGEDQEFEVARRFVRLAGEAAATAAAAPAAAPPQVAVQNAIATAAQRHAPGLLNGMKRGPGSRRRQRGTWVRRGRTIVLFEA
jgi:hypothetical protein